MRSSTLRELCSMYPFTIMSITYGLVQVASVEGAVFYFVQPPFYF